MKHFGLVVALSIVGSSAFVSHALSAVGVQKPEFTLSLPDGWVEIPQEVLTGLNQQAPNAKIPKYDYGFQLETSPILSDVDWGRVIGAAIIGGLFALFAGLNRKKKEG